MEGLQRLVPVLVLVIAIASVVAAVALWKTAGATDDRACVEAAEARYPAVGVSAFVTRDRRDTGPIKLSFVTERQKAVDACD
jgi:hypothetical protein